MKYLLFQRLRVSILLSVAAGILSVGVVLFLPNYYRSEATLLPSEKKTGLGSISMAASALGVSLPNSNAGEQGFVEILRSRWMAESLLEAKWQFKERSNIFSREVNKNVVLRDYLKCPDMDVAVMKLQRILTVQRDVQTNLVIIKAQTRSPELSQQLVIKATNLLGEFLEKRNQTRGGHKAVLAQTRLEEARCEYEKAEAVLRRFALANRNYRQSSLPDVSITGARLEADLLLRRQVVTSLTLSLEQALIDQKDDTPILNILDRGSLPSQKSEPKRGFIVLTVMLLTGVVSAIVTNWRILLPLLRPSDRGVC